MVIERMLNDHRVFHESNLGMMIRQRETGVLYANAEDNVPCKYTYEETDIPIPEYSATEEKEYERGKA